MVNITEISLLLVGRALRVQDSQAPCGGPAFQAALILRHPRYQHVLLPLLWREWEPGELCPGSPVFLAERDTYA